jgi:hypothetical protein
MKVAKGQVSFVVMITILIIFHLLINAMHFLQDHIVELLIEQEAISHDVAIH